MANTIDADLLADIISEMSETKLQNVVPNYDLFTTDFSDEALSVRAGAGARSTIQVPIATAGSTVQRNATNFESGDGTILSQPITMNQETASFHITNAERQQASRLERLVKINMHALLNKTWATTSALFTAANFTTLGTVLDKDPATVVAADLKALWASLEKSGEKNLIVDSTFYSQFLPTTKESFDPSMPGVYGFSRWAHASDWSNAGTNVNGVIAAPSAIVMAARLPDTSSKLADIIGQSTVALPNGLVVQVNNWVNSSTRAEWSSFDIVFGAGVGDESALGLIEDGTV